MVLVSRSATPLKGSSNSPREPSFKDSAIALMVKSRRRRSSWMVAGSDDGRLASLLKALGARHADFGAGIAGKRPVKIVRASSSTAVISGAGLLEIFLELEWIALNREIEVADGEPADNVADRPAGQVKVHARGAGYILNQRRRPSVDPASAGVPSCKCNQPFGFKRRSGLVPWRFRCEICPAGEEADSAKAFHKISTGRCGKSDQGLNHLYASGLIQSTYSNGNIAASSRK